MATYILTAAQLNSRILNSFSIPSSTTPVIIIDPDAQAFITAADITNPTQQSAIDNLVIGLKADGLWSQMTAIYPFVGGTAAAHKYNLKDPRDLNAAYRLTFFGGWTHDSRGITGNGTNTYADTYFSGSVSAVGVYTPTEYGSYTSFGYNELVGYCDSEGCSDSPGQQIYLYTSAGQFSVYPYENVPGFYGLGHGQVGYISGNQVGYKNGRRISTTPYAFVGPVVSRDTIPVGAMRYVTIDGNANTVVASSVSNYTNAVQSFAYFSNAILDDTETANLYTRIQTFQTALGRQVANLPVSDPDVFAFLNNRKIIDPVNSLTEINAVNDLVVSLKAQSLWNKMTAIFPIVSDTRNLLSFTDDFQVGNWAKDAGVTVTANNSIAPNGNNNADTIVIPNNSAISQSLTSATSQTYTFSIYLRAASNITVKIGFDNVSVLTTCNVTTSWQRFTITHTFTGVAFPQIYNDSGSSVTLIAWGAMAQLGSTATTYQEIGNTSSNRIGGQFLFSLKYHQANSPMQTLGFDGSNTFALTGITSTGVGRIRLGNSGIGNILTAGDAHISAYSRTAVTPATNLALWGVRNTSPVEAIALARFTSTPFTVQSAMGGTSIQTSSFINTQGLIMASITGYGTNLNGIYQSGILRASSTAPNPSPIPGSELIFNGYLNDGTTIDRASFEIAFISAGQGLTSAEVITFNNIINTYQTALSRNV